MARTDNLVQCVVWKLSVRPGLVANRALSQWPSKPDGRMCTPECLTFIGRALAAAEVAGKRVIEVGSYDVNGSVRAAVEAHRPSTYVGVDISSGPSVDVVLDASKLLERFEPGSFDIVLSTEMIEHVRDWRTVIDNMKGLCAPAGIVVMTTRSPGFRYHAYPDDFWRYEPADMALIFADFEMEMLESEKDPGQPGVFVKARRRDMTSLDLRPIALYSVITDDRRVSVTDWDLRRFQAVRRINLAVKPVTRRIPQNAKAPFKKKLGLGPGFQD
jgi:SAM-dependent methyltransferase